MNKLFFLFWFFTAIIAAIILKLFIIQILASDSYISHNYLKTQKILPKRGRILDRNEQTLVLNQTTYLLYAEPKKITDKKIFSQKINSILDIDTATIEAKINTNKLWVSISFGLDKEKRDKIADFNLKGLGFNEEDRRFYPEGSSAAHLLGFVGKNTLGDNIGYFGIEGYYEKDLSGLPGILKSERDLLGNPIFIGTQDKLKEEDGPDLILTIDKSIQLIVKEKLKEKMDRLNAKEGCVIIADPFSLEIISLVCLPDFDPTEYYKFSEEYFKNPAISSLYEPGSIFKPLLMAAAIEEKAVKPDDTFEEKGPIRIEDKEIQTWDKKYEGEITMTRILEKSSNVGMVYVGQKLGSKKILSYLTKYGFNEDTDIDLQGEISSSFKKEKDWYPVDYATITFGQGIAVTQIQMIRAFSSIINGGYLLRPYIVSKIVSADKKSTKISPKKVRRVINGETSLIIKKMLESTIDNAEARWAKPEGYRIGGKTGTAQIAVGRHYDPSKTIASFIGFAPVDKPKFIIMVTFKEPSTSIWGSETAAPLFFEIAKELFVYYNILPE